MPPSVKRRRRKNLAAYVDPLAPAPTGDKPMGNIIIIIIILTTIVSDRASSVNHQVNLEYTLQQINSPIK